MEPLVFDDITPITEPVRLGKKLYVLREADGEAITKWKNMQIRSARMQDGQVVGMGEAADSQPYLIHMCLYEATENGDLYVLQNGEPDPKYRVPISVIRRWKGTISEKIYDRIIEISGLQDDKPDSIRKQIERLQSRLSSLESKGEDPWGNSQETTTDGSG